MAFPWSPSRPRPAAVAAGPECRPVRIAILPALEDNYIYVLEDGRRAVVVDPGVAGPVAAWLRKRGLEPVAVLHTHHHRDHIGGTPELLRLWPGLAVVAARADRERIPFQTIGVGEGDRLDLLGRRLEVWEVPGHTGPHIAFLLGAPDSGAGDLFCGDTLFAGGCGRLKEGTAAELFASLGRIAALPPATRLWCSHEYTETNLRWAARQFPGDGAIAARLAEVRRLRAAGRPTLPTTVAVERATNLFLRAPDVETFAALRQSRDHWRG